MKIHTYYQPVSGMAPADKLLALWSREWSSRGWEPVILNQEHAKTHPGYAYFVDKVSRFPTSNPRQYELACFVRHLAMANIGGGMLVDYDVMLRDSSKAGNFPLPKHPVLFEPTRVPCAVLGSENAFEELCDILCEYRLEPGETHASDMTIIRKTNLQAESYCVEHLCSGEPIRDHLGEGWKKAPMIHFSNYSFSKLGWTGDKADLIHRVLSTL